MSPPTGTKLAPEGSPANELQSSEKGPGQVVASAPLVLKELVQRFRVCWEVWPEYVFVGKEKRQTGFALELYGTHEAGTGHVDPGCLHCQRVFAALQAIADWIQPRETRPSIYEIAPYNQSISYSPARQNRNDVSLTLRILHREQIEAPVDACDVRCLTEMKQRLRELGASEGRWLDQKEEP